MTTTYDASVEMHCQADLRYWCTKVQCSTSRASQTSLKDNNVCYDFYYGLLEYPRSQTYIWLCDLMSITSVVSRIQQKYYRLAEVVSRDERNKISYHTVSLILLIVSLPRMSLLNDNILTKTYNLFTLYLNNPCICSLTNYISPGRLFNYGINDLRFQRPTQASVFKRIRDIKGVMYSKQRLYQMA